MTPTATISNAPPLRDEIRATITCYTGKTALKDHVEWLQRALPTTKEGRPAIGITRTYQLIGQPLAGEFPKPETIRAMSHALGWSTMRTVCIIASELGLDDEDY